jgi:1-acyl-sn-glycerol-3-phosphate acyltransferase
MIDAGNDTFGVRLLRGSLLCLMRILFRIEHCGMERIPMSGPLLIVANHGTYFDPFWIAVRVRRRLRFMAWDKIFKFPPAGRLFRWLGAFPVSLENPEYGAFKTALKILKDGEALMIFPEGGRSPDGALLPFKEGAARLALRTGATVLPVVIRGGDRVWGPKMLLPRPRKVKVEYLPPIHKEAFGSDDALLTAQMRGRILESMGSQGPVRRTHKP